MAKLWSLRCAEVAGPAQRISLAYNGFVSVATAVCRRIWSRSASQACHLPAVPQQCIAKMGLMCAAGGASGASSARHLCMAFSSCMLHMPCTRAHWHGPAASVAAASHPPFEDQATMQRAHVVHQGKAGWHAAPQRCRTSPSRLQAAATGPTANPQSASIGPVLDFIALPESPKAERPAGLAGASDKSSGQPRPDAVAVGGEASPGDPSLPWGRVSGRIQSPLLRLHTGMSA